MVKLVDIEILDQIKPVYIEQYYKKLWINVFLEGKPLGRMQYNISKINIKKIEPEQIRKDILESFSDKMWEHLILNKYLPAKIENHNDHKISVVICTKDRAAYLRQCLSSLMKVSYSNFEVIVVDNKSEDKSIQRIVNEFEYKYVREDNLGLNFARNRGIKESSGDIIAYIDDDADASKNWLKQISIAFDNPDVMAVTGLILPAEINEKAQYNFEKYGGMSKGFTEKYISLYRVKPPELFWASGWGVGANMAFRRDIFDRIGNFNLSLDLGTPTCGGGDIEFFFRLVSAGYSLHYVPSAYIKHYHRRENKALSKQILNNGKSFPAYLMTIYKQNEQYRKSIIWFFIYNWVFQWLILNLIKSIIRLDITRLKFAISEIAGSLFSYTSFKRSLKSINLNS